MKFLFRLLSVIIVSALTATMCLSASAYRAELVSVAVCEDLPEEVHTVLTYENGETAELAFAPDIEAIDGTRLEETIESYEVFYLSESVITVEFGEYYSAEFVLPETNKTVFLAGLVVSNISEVQEKIIKGYTEGENFDIASLSFIDAEKTKDDQDDDNLCWAASAADLLTYTGWAAKAGFETEDDVFEAFISAFTDNGGDPYYGIGWFVNGVDTFYQVNRTAAHVKDYGSSGGYLPDYAYDRIAGSQNTAEDFTLLEGAIEKLREGYGVGLGVDIFTTSGSYMGGHAVTMWGYITDNDYTPDDPAYYDMLMITDSDSDKSIEGIDRRESENILNLYSLSYDNRTHNTTDYSTLAYATSINRILLSSYTYLMPYSDEIEREQSESATKNKSSDPDIAVSECYLSSDEDDLSCHHEFIIGDTVRFTPVIRNVGDYDFVPDGALSMSMKVTNQNGSILYDKTYSVRPTIGVSSYSHYGLSYFYIENMKKGDYTLTLSFNADEKQAEAYYYNNTYTTTFSVVPEENTYLVGDTDGSYSISVIDATLIQRLLARIIPDEDGMSMRGNVFEKGRLSVLSATQLQRYLAKLEFNSPIGEKRYYTDQQ